MKLPKILFLALYVIGFILLTICMSQLYAISNTAWALGAGASFGTLLFTTALNHKDDA